MLTPLTRQPVVSTANIAQLAVDLLIASLSLRVIGVFDSGNLVPVVGGREDEAEGISTPLECELRAHPIHPPACNRDSVTPLQCLEAKSATLWSFNSGHLYWWYVSVRVASKLRSS